MVSSDLTTQRCFAVGLLAGWSLTHHPLAPGALRCCDDDLKRDEDPGVGSLYTDWPDFRTTDDHLFGLNKYLDSFTSYPAGQSPLDLGKTQHIHVLIGYRPLTAITDLTAIDNCLGS